MAERWLPSTAASLSPRTDTGTTATSGLSTSSPCAARWVRRAPEQTASTTSLIVDPKRVLSARTFAMSSSAKAIARSAPTGDSNVSGAPSGIDTGPRRSSTAQRASRTAVRPTSRAARIPRSGLRRKLGSASVIRPGLRRQAGGNPRRARLGDGAALGGQVEQLGQHLGAGHAVDDGVVHLGDQPDPAVRHPLDDVHLPGRLLRASAGGPSPRRPWRGIRHRRPEPGGRRGGDDSPGRSRGRPPSAGGPGRGGRA